MTDENGETFEYVGFWARVGATVIDLVATMIVTAPLTFMVYGRYTSPTGVLYMGVPDFIINVLLPMAMTIGLWVILGATPGKMALNAKVVDADTGKLLTIKAAVIRNLGQLISMLPFCLGFLWVAFDDRKQGWHDKLANSVVVRPVRSPTIRFNGP